jgi:hypothetical protein
MSTNARRFFITLTLLLTALVTAWTITLTYSAERTRVVNQQEQGAEDRFQQLLKSRYDSALKIFQIEETLVERGRSTLANLCVSARRVRDAALDLSSKREDQLAAHNQYLAVVRRFEENVNKVAESGMASPSDKELARYLRCDAEIALLKTARTSNPPF